jgi:lipopolysaccharide heptosyltransferase II
MVPPRSIRPRTSPLRGRYLVDNRKWNAFLRVADRILGAVVQRTGVRPPPRPRRVLLAVGGHLGDAVIATGVVSLLRRAIPEVEIGMALGSWAAAAIEGHPDVRWIHTVDHWKSNRSGAALPNRWLHDRRTRRRALREIRAVGYDVSVDLYMYYPNMAGLLWRAGIPVRIGYASGGYASLYTHAVDWVDGEYHVAQQETSLLRILAPTLPDAAARWYDLPPVPTDASHRAESTLLDAGATPGDYLVVHMGAGSPLKEWPAERWRELAERLTDEGHYLVLTGSGRAEQQRADEVARGRTRCADLTGRLAWPEFVHVLARARLVLCVDTVAAHVAAAVGTPCVALWAAMTRINHWRPLGTSCTVLTNHVPCAPCFRSRGCETMACVRGLTVDAVHAAVQSRLTVSHQLQGVECT